MVASDTTFSTEGTAQNEPMIALEDDKMSDGERAAVSSLISSMEGVKLELQSALSSASPSEREALEGQLSVLNGSITSLKAARNNKSGISASIASAAGVVNYARDKISDEKIAAFDSSVSAYSGGYIASDYGNISTADKSFLSNQFTNSKSMSWFGGLDAKNQSYMMGIVNDQVAKDPEMRAGIVAARVFSENATLNAMQQKNIDENKADIAEAKAYALKNGDKELLQAIEANEKLLASRQKANDYTFSTPWKDAIKDGVLTSEERKGIIDFSKSETARRKEDFKEINDNVFDALPKGQKNALTEMYKKEHKGVPTNEDLQKFVKEAKPDQKQLNDALHVMNKHAPENSTPQQKKDAIARLSPAQREAFVLATAQTNMQVAEIGYDMKECLQNLNEEQKKELATTLQKMIDKGDKEGAIAILEKLNGDKSISESTKQLIMKSNSLKIDKILEDAQKVGTQERGSFRDFRETVSQDKGWESRVFDFGQWLSFKPYIEENVAQENAPKDATASTEVASNNQFSALLTGFTPPTTPIVASSSENIQFSTAPISLGSLGVTAANSNSGVATTGSNSQAQTVAIAGR